MPSQITTDKAKLRYMFRVSSPPQSRSKAVVCVSTPRMYPRSGYFLVNHKTTLQCFITSLESVPSSCVC